MSRDSTQHVAYVQGLFVLDRQDVCFLVDQRPGSLTAGGIQGRSLTTHGRRALKAHLGAVYDVDLRSHHTHKNGYRGHECQWNGPSWPFATAVTLTALANLLNGPRYHGRWLTILWDKTGDHYHKGRGLQVLANGETIAAAPTLRRVTGALPPPAR